MSTDECLYLFIHMNDESKTQFKGELHISYITKVHLWNSFSCKLKQVNSPHSVMLVVSPTQDAEIDA